MWRRLGFEQLRVFVSLRRAHFITLTSSTTYQDHVASLVEDLDRDDQLGLLANAVAAKPAPLFEHRQHLVNTTARRIEGGIGPELGAQLAMYSILESQGGPELDHEVLTRCLLEDVGGSPRGEAVIDDLPADIMPRLALSLFNLAGRLNEPAQDTIAGLIGRRAAKIEDPIARDAAEQEHDVFMLERQLSDPDFAVNSFEVSERWKNRGDGMNYSHVLLLLLERDVADLHAVAASVGLLEKIDEPSRTSPLWLAHRLMLGVHHDALFKKLNNEEVGRASGCAIRFLNRWHPLWIPHLTGSQNVDILRALRDYDRPGREQHTVELAKQMARQQTESLEATLRPLMRQGRFFEIVWHYFRTLSWCGLETTPNVNPFEIQALSAEERMAHVTNHQHSWPVPFANDSRACPLSGEFLIVSHSLFHAPAFAGDLYSPGRDHVTEVSRKAIPQLLNNAVAMPFLGEEVKDVLRHHERVLTMPDYAIA